VGEDSGARPDAAREADGPLVRSERDGVTVRITLDSPHNRNALSRRLLAELKGALERAAEDEGARAVVLTGAGSVFCSGADLRERRAGPDPAAEAGPGVPEVLTAIVRCPLPVVARVNGPVRAGGMGIVAASDLAVAASDATFAFSEVRVGVAPAVIAVPTLAVAEPRALSRYALTGEVFGADAAAAMGLLTAVVAPGGLDAWVTEVVVEVAKGAPGAVAATKALLADLRLTPWDAALATAAARSAAMFSLAEAAEGMAAFLERRPADWT